ncbi:unnamed protein product [Gongylonema pulchrum]|uniref:Vanin_C domain-containing protein n=1 Tax=Gongylonema pulchrum TaxID=637853 RepID=A0A183DFV2_9BILA|nr:unnamed protein product [Gongylonema pulchrum]
MQICNGIGTPVDSKYTNLEPKYVAMNGSEVVIANNFSFIVWPYNIPRASTRELNSSIVDTTSTALADTLYYVDKNEEKVDLRSLDAQRQSQVMKTASLFASNLQ